MIILSGCLILKDNSLLLLYQSKHRHFETPGGKVEFNECENPEDPTEDDLKRTAERETYEELGDKIKLKDPEYFANTAFTIPDGRRAVAHKFLTKIISGEPIVNEPENFDRLEFLPVKNLEDFPISPDLKILLPQIKEKLQ